jgi:hypothetical protein
LCPQVCNSSKFVINLQQVCKCQVATSLILTDLLQVVLSNLLATSLMQVDETICSKPADNNLEQA